MSERRFACPHCGQHYATEAVWHQESLDCAACGRAFQPGALLRPDPEPDRGGPGPAVQAVQPPLAPAPAPVRSQKPLLVTGGQPRGRAGRGSPLVAGGGGFFTPLLILVAMAFVASWTWVFALLACPLAAYFLSLKLCQAVGRSGGAAALRTYVRTTLLSFLFWAVLPLGVLRFLEGDDAAEFMLALLFVPGLAGLGAGFVCFALAATQCWRQTSFP